MKQDSRAVQQTIHNFIDKNPIENIAAILQILHTTNPQEQFVDWSSDDYYKKLNTNIENFIDYMRYKDPINGTTKPLKILRRLRKIWLCLRELKKATKNLSLVSNRHEHEVKAAEIALYAYLETLKQEYNKNASPLRDALERINRWHYFLDSFSFLGDLEIIQIFFISPTKNPQNMARAFLFGPDNRTWWQYIKSFWSLKNYSTEPIFEQSDEKHDTRTWLDFYYGFLSTNNKQRFKKFEDFLNSDNHADSTRNCKNNIFFQEVLHHKELDKITNNMNHTLVIFI